VALPGAAGKLSSSAVLIKPGLAGLFFNSLQYWDPPVVFRSAQRSLINPKEGPKMKSSILFALMATTLLTAACGKDSKSKSAPQSTVYHFNSGEGYCFEVVQEELAAKGFGLPDDATLGSCPQQTTLQGSVSVTRYASCPTVLDNGVPMMAVFYTKMVNDEGDILDLTLLSPQSICQQFAE
jgi:hypothetical protein